MSNPDTVLEQECKFKEALTAIKLIVEPKDKDIGGFSVRRALPNRQQRNVGPWIFFDHMGPAHFQPGHGLNVRPHPHINLATVTYLFEGEILHRDSIGSLQVIRPGDINLMLAGSGIVHSEREPSGAHQRQRTLHGLQLWLSLPDAMEELPPAFFHYAAQDIPVIEVNKVSVRVMMGKAYGVRSPVKTFAETLYVEAHLKPGQALELPYCDERAVYVASGNIDINSNPVAEHCLAILKPEKDIHVTASEESRIAIIGGEAMPPRFMEWNFVSSRKERIEEAKRDWQQGRFDKVVGDEKEYIPYP